MDPGRACSGHATTLGELVMFRCFIAIFCAAAFSTSAYAEAGKPVPEINFLTWPAAKFQHYHEPTNYIAEQWRKLGLEVRVNPQPFPNPMLRMWFTDHEFDAVISVLTGSPDRLEPDFFTNAQFNSANAEPGNFNVGEFSNEKVDELGNKQLGIYDAEERQKVIYELQEVIYEEKPELIIAHPIAVHAINTDNVEIVDYVEHPDGIRGYENILRMQAKHDGPVRIGWTIDQSTLNPMVASTLEDQSILSLIYDRLVVVGPDGSPDMWIATSVDILDDTTIDVKLRDDHTFSDGEPVTVEDVKFSFDFFKDEEVAYYKKYLDRLESVEILDDETVRFKLSQPYAPFIMNTLGQIYILPQHVWSTVTEDLDIEKPQDFANNEPVGSGPYTVRHRREGQEIYLEAREDHFAGPKSDILRIVFGSAEVIGQSLKAGSIDASFQPIVPIAIPEFESQDNIKLYRARSNGYISARLNTAGPVFYNRDLRRALAYAVPYEAIIEEILGGNGGRSASPIVPVNEFWHNPDLPLPELDLDKARSMLEEAGFTWDDNGRMHFPSE
jgi:peptide/nickel transport system substrate-binding protein